MNKNNGNFENKLKKDNDSIKYNKDKLKNINLDQNDYVCENNNNEDTTNGECKHHNDKIHKKTTTVANKYINAHNQNMRVDTKTSDKTMRIPKNKGVTNEKNDIRAETNNKKQLYNKITCLTDKKQAKMDLEPIFFERITNKPRLHKRPQYEASVETGSKIDIESGVKSDTQNDIKCNVENNTENDIQNNRVYNVQNVVRNKNINNIRDDLQDDVQNYAQNNSNFYVNKENDLDNVFGLVNFEKEIDYCHFIKYELHNKRYKNTERQYYNTMYGSAGYKPTNRLQHIECGIIKQRYAGSKDTKDKYKSQNIKTNFADKTIYDKQKIKDPKYENDEINNKIYKDIKAKHDRYLMLQQPNTSNLFDNNKKDDAMLNNQENNYDEFINDSNNKNIEILQKEYIKNLKDFENKQYSMNLDQVILNNILLKMENEIYFYDKKERNEAENEEQKICNVFMCCDQKNLDFYGFSNHIEKYHPREFNTKLINNENYKKEKLFKSDVNNKDIKEEKNTQQNEKCYNKEMSNNSGVGINQAVKEFVTQNNNINNGICSINYENNLKMKEQNSKYDTCDEYHAANSRYFNYNKENEMKQYKISTANTNKMEIKWVNYPQNELEKNRTDTNENLEYENKKFRCEKPSCNRVFTSKAGLLYHTEHGHVMNQYVIKPYVCTVKGCTKRYKNQNGLKYHTEHSH